MEGEKMWDRVFRWSARTSWVAVLGFGAAFFIGGQSGKNLGTASVLVFLLGLLFAWIAFDEQWHARPGKKLVRGGGLALLFAMGTTLAATPMARAEVDCLWSGIACSEGSICAWDTERRIHRCTVTDDPGFPAALWPCELQQESVCVADRTTEYHACLDAVQQHNTTCTLRRRACSEAARTASSYYCRPAVDEMRNGRWYPQVAKACMEAIRAAAIACTPPDGAQ